MRKKKPNIAVTGPDKGGFPAWIFTWLAVRRAGGKPIRVRPSQINKIPDFDGLIIGGGADVNPELYDGDPISDIQNLNKSEKIKSGFRRFLHIMVSIFITLIRNVFSLGYTDPVDVNRDELEQKMLQRALDNNKPILGICRGAQLINVHFGGDLHQAIGEFYNEIPKIDTIYPKKEIIIEPDSALRNILGDEKAMVNSLHNQAVNKTGKGIRIVAKEKTGVAQAIEHTEYSFVIGIQWHPEYLPQISAQQQLFRHLISESQKS